MKELAAPIRLFSVLLLLVISAYLLSGGSVLVKYKKLADDNMRSYNRVINDLEASKDSTKKIGYITEKEINKAKMQRINGGQS